MKSAGQTVLEWANPKALLAATALRQERSTQVAAARVIPLHPKITALEFFSGAGLARAGMDAAGVKTIWANDIDNRKCNFYSAQWGNANLHCLDVFDIEAEDVPTADIAWASSPCTDLSLAGKRSGLESGKESSAFFGFMQVIGGMGKRKPNALILENVCGLASSHDGNDYRLVVESFNRLGYSVDAFELNARRWLPQSRPRMFVVGLLNPIDGGAIDTCIRPDRLAWIHADKSLMTHVTPTATPPELLVGGFTAFAEDIPFEDKRWWGAQQIDSFVASLSPTQSKRCEKLMQASTAVARTAYRRTRAGKLVWEVREDDIAGCLRTARGGSSRQAVAILGNGKIHVRWMTGLEYARLQGAGNFKLEGFSEAQIQYAFGDAVAIPAVTWLMRHAVLPAIIAQREMGVSDATSAATERRSA